MIATILDDDADNKEVRGVAVEDMDTVSDLPLFVTRSPRLYLM